MHRYRKDFSEVLVSSNSNLTKNRFMRLFFLSVSLLLVLLPFQFYTLYRNASFPMLPYTWDLVHGDTWQNIHLVPTGGVVTFDRWIQIAFGFTVFALFGLGHDATAMYRTWLLQIGFGKIFPSLIQPKRAMRNPSSMTRSHTESMSSRTRLFFVKNFSRGSLSSA